MRPNPALKKLGFADNDRLVIIHVDDIGMCQASVDAFAELDAFGLISSGAVMVPCPWFLEAAKHACQHPNTDLGVHLTLNSEWDTYRWAPLSTVDPATGLIDEQGFFHQFAHQTQENADPAAVRIEMQTQIKRAKEAGIDITHFDTHMGTVAHKKFMQDYFQIAISNGLPPMMVRLDEKGWYQLTVEHEGAELDEEAIAMGVQLVHTLEEMGVPLIDRISGLPLDTDPSLRMQQAKQVFAELPVGITHFIVHAAKDTPELRAIAPDWACRVADYKTFLKDELREYINTLGVHVIGYRALRDLMKDLSY
jgi:predicted glycoside hydrolase/deacetylase ChbG (UPF0249 family)